jgi:hypothetical protein
MSTQQATLGRDVAVEAAENVSPSLCAFEIEAFLVVDVALSLLQGILRVANTVSYSLHWRWLERTRIMRYLRFLAVCEQRCKRFLGDFCFDHVCEVIQKPATVYLEDLSIQPNTHEGNEFTAPHWPAASSSSITRPGSKPLESVNKRTKQTKQRDRHTLLLLGPVVVVGA